MALAGFWAITPIMIPKRIPLHRFSILPLLRFTSQTTKLMQPQVPTPLVARRCVAALLIVFGLLAYTVNAQVQQAWVARYNNGLPAGTNQATKLLLDSAGNIYITGFSQNTNGNLDYTTIKYSPNGTQLWAARYDSSNVISAMPAGIVLDTSNN